MSGALLSQAFLKDFTRGLSVTTILVVAAAGCSSKSSLTFDLDNVTPLVSSFAEVERLDDQEYYNYVHDAVEMVVSGDEWGERLLRFLDDRGVYRPERLLRQTSMSPPGRSFWVTVYTPDPGTSVFFFVEDLRALHLPKIAMGKAFLGIIVSHELQHAYDVLVRPELTEMGSIKHVILELNAFKLAVDLADRYTEGRYGAVINEALERKEYKRKNRLLLFPKSSVVNRLDQLFGAPSPWELSLRSPLYILGLSYADCNNLLERSYTTCRFLNFAGLYVNPPGVDWFGIKTHTGLDVEFEKGEEVHSPIRGRIVQHLRDNREHSNWQGVVIKGIAEDSERMVRMLGLVPSLEVGSVVFPGNLVGVVQNPKECVKNLKPHIHLELYEQGVRTDAEWILQERWQDRTGSTATTGTYYYMPHKGKRLLVKGFKLEEKRNYENAINVFKEALEYGWWDISNTPIYHFIARSYAALGDYENASEYQQIAVDLLRMEMDYARGALPDEALGTIGACSEPSVLNSRLRHQESNLEAYRNGNDAIYIY